MVDEQIRFIWRISERGYKTIRGITTLSGGELLTAQREATIISDGLVHVSDLFERKYEPLKQYTGLFREFAETEANEKGVTKFANEYGLLGLPMIEVQSISRRENKDMRLSGEPIDDWFNAIQEMAEAVEIWESTRKTHAKKGGEGQGHNIAAHSKDIGAIVNIIEAHLSGHSIIVFDFEPHSDHAMVLIEPDNLLSAMWLQFAIAIEEGKQYRRCKYCRTWFGIHPGTSRSDRQYCSDSCRYKAYRERKARAE